MALLSEAYFKCVDTNWESDGQEGEQVYSLYGIAELMLLNRTSISERSTTLSWRLRPERVWDTATTGVLDSKASYRGSYSR